MKIHSFLGTIKQTPIAKLIIVRGETKHHNIIRGNVKPYNMGISDECLFSQEEAYVGLIGNFDLVHARRNGEEVVNKQGENIYYLARPEYDSDDGSVMVILDITTNTLEYEVEDNANLLGVAKTESYKKKMLSFFVYLDDDDDNFSVTVGEDIWDIVMIKDRVVVSSS